MVTSSKKSILLATGPWDPRPWAAAIRAADPERPLFVWPEVPNPAAVAYALVWNPTDEVFSTLPSLEAVFSLGAGVDHLMGLKEPASVPVVRVVNPDLTQRMTEWVVLQVLIHHRQQKAYERQQAERIWQELKQPAAADIRVGIMGLGVLGRDAAAALQRLGFQIAGWSRRPAIIPGIACFHGREMLDSFLARTDILVCLLPLTPDTRNILSMPLFHKLARGGAPGGPVVINAGRGGLQVEADIVSALERGVLGGASLDVFENEPLDPQSPLWAHPNVVITPHAAAASAPEAIIPEILRQISDFEMGKPLANVVDRQASY